MQKLIKYLELHIISLNQDLEDLSTKMDNLDPNSKEFRDLETEHIWTSGQISATEHIAEYVYEIA